MAMDLGFLEIKVMKETTLMIKEMVREYINGEVRATIEGNF